MVLAFSLIVNFEDETNRKSSTKIRLPTTFAISDYIEFAQAAGQLIVDATNARVTNISLTIDFDLSGLGLSAIALLPSNVGKKALFLWQTVTAGLPGKFTVPTVDESIFPAGTDDMDQSAPIVAPFIAAIENGLAVAGPATVTFENNRGLDIVTLASAYELHTKTG